MKLALVIAAFVALPVMAVLAGWAAIRWSHVSSVVYTLTAIAILFCLVGAFTKRDCSQPVWIGCGLFAASYFLTTLNVDNLWSLTAELLHCESPLAQPRLITTHWLAATYDGIGTPQIWTSGGTRVPAEFLLTVPPKSIPNDLYLDALNSYLHTGHCVLTWMAGLAGGMLASIFARKNDVDLEQPKLLSAM